MLREIQSNAFICNGQVRPPIRFSDGLNVVKGTEDFVNSIGKSTFLMVIDFVFGGEDYITKLKNVHRHIPDHTINFTFEFDGKSYYFSRSTASADIVTTCSEGYVQTQETRSVNDFTAWLKMQYGIINPLTFRSIVSRFFRIYNRENLNELLPLRSYKDETDGKSIEALIRLFDLYAPIERASRDAEDAEDKKKAFTEAQKYDYIPLINKTKYKDNIKRIEELEKKKVDLAERSSQNLLDLDSETSALLSELKSELSKLKRQRGKLYTQLDKIKDDREMKGATYHGDFSVLQEYFPNVNIDRLQTVEEFHKNISAILAAELKDAEKELWNSINLLNMQINKIELEIASLQTAPNLPKVVLDEYAKIDKELNQLVNENECYDKLAILKDTYDKKAAILKESMMIQAGLLQESVNGKMSELNATIFPNAVNAPRLTIVTPKQYSFYTPEDDGTGTNFKGMVVFDIACLALTVLPALVHDSYVLKQISKTSIEKIFELYEAAGKQIFVAFDNLSAYGSRTTEIVNSHTVLELGAGENCLYGKYFGTETIE